MFGLVGVYILLSGLENKLYSKIVTLLAGLLFSGDLRLISFSTGERISTSTTSYFPKQRRERQTLFAIVTLLIDAMIIAVVIYRLRNRRND